MYPDAADVDGGEQARAHHGEDRHRLGEAVDARPPLLPEEEQDGRDQRAGVADADPEDEVGDVEGPAHRPVEVPHAHAGEEQVQDHQPQHAQQGQREMAMATYQACGGCRASATPATASVTACRLWPGSPVISVARRRGSSRVLSIS